MEEKKIQPASTDIEPPKRAASKRWSHEEESQLAKAFSAGQSLAELAEAHERSEGAISARLAQLDLIDYGPYTALSHESHLPQQEESPENSGKPWQEDELALLLEVHGTEGTAEALLELAKKLQRSPRSMVLKLVHVGALVPMVNKNPRPVAKAPSKAALSQSKKEAATTEPAAPKKMMKVSITPEFQTAYKTIADGDNLLILGGAGTGKSTFLKWLRKKLGDEKQSVVLAPTGMAALQVGGQTIHSFFGLKTNLANEKEAWHKPRRAKMYQKLDLIIIDEISMVRADVFQAIDAFLRRYGPHKGKPFGGVQMLLMGDLFQLSPVVRFEEKPQLVEAYGSPFFFSSPAWGQGNFYFIEFTKIFRQSDVPFVSLLNRVRHGEKSQNLLAELNKRVVSEHKEGVVLAARNRTVEVINERELARLKSKEHIYKAEIHGKIDEKAFLSPAELLLKEGARVMFTRNDALGRWVNGTLGEVVACKKGEVSVRTDEGKIFTVEPSKWELTKYELNPETEEMVGKVAGSFVQLPLTLAWALTIHKAQGQTLESCTIDLSDGGAFAEGQLYVALSRVRSLEGLHLAHPVSARDIRTSHEVQAFYQMQTAANLSA